MIGAGYRLSPRDTVADKNRMLRCRVGPGDPGADVGVDYQETVMKSIRLTRCGGF